MCYGSIMYYGLVPSAAQGYSHQLESANLAQLPRLRMGLAGVAPILAQVS